MRNKQEQTLPAEVNPLWRVGIVASSFYKEEMESMIEAAHALLLQAGIHSDGISIHTVPGSFEIPLIGSALAKAGSVDALIGLGIIVEGETQHARLLAEQSARGIMDVQLQYNMPFAFEILYVHTMEQARKRARGEQNKGTEAAHAVLHSLAKLHTILS